MKYLNKTALLLAVVCSALLSGCTSEPEAERALSGAGYNNITMTGYRFFLCDERDSWSTGFKATGPSGQRVTGAVCSGVMKGATVRLD
jgi:hypothetical protein